jgi:hypothetical protein
LIVAIVPCRMFPSVPSEAVVRTIQSTPDSMDSTARACAPAGAICDSSIAPTAATAAIASIGAIASAEIGRRYLNVLPLAPGANAMQYHLRYAKPAPGIRPLCRPPPLPSPTALLLVQLQHWPSQLQPSRLTLTTLLTPRPLLPLVAKQPCWLHSLYCLCRLRNWLHLTGSRQQMAEMCESNLKRLSRVNYPLCENAREASVPRIALATHDPTTSTHDALHPHCQPTYSYDALEAAVKLSPVSARRSSCLGDENTADCASSTA